MATGTIQIPGYEMLRPLGSGGMSTVFLALQRSLDRKVAIKIMRRGGGEETSNDVLQAEKRFLLEGRMMAKLPHRNIVAVYDIVSTDRLAYIAMEYLNGGALTDRMRSGIALADAISVIVQIAGALEFAHNHGVVHRDLKPANIMFRDAATPVLTDFGIARYQDGSATRLTQTGMLVGTPTYMSPEQINGAPVDGRADQYSLGILFYELLTGAPPFRGDTPIAVLMAHLTQVPAPLPDEFHAFQDIFDRVLAKNRDERYPTLKAFSDDLKSRLVHSDTLLMRLQLDPNQSSSEHLRALGFNTSTPAGGGLRASLAGAGLDAPVAAAAAATVKMAPARPRWLWPVAAVVVLLAIVAAWVLFGHRALTRDERELVNLWGDHAADLVKAGQFFVTAPGSDGSALDFIRKVQQKDPGNARAQTLLDEIGKQLAAQGDAALAGSRFDEATQIDQQGLAKLPEDKALLALKPRIAQALAAAQTAAATATQQAAQRQAARDHIDKLLASASVDDLGAALNELAQLSAQDPVDQETLALRARAIEPIGRRLQAATSSADFDAVAALLKNHEKGWGSDPAFAALLRNVPGWRTKIAAAEQARAAALRGELVLNATPWATVESVVDADQHAVTLPDDATTPLVLSVAAGKYQVRFRQPLNGATRQVDVTVDAKKRVPANAAFGTISAQEYFSRAGW